MVMVLLVHALFIFCELHSSAKDILFYSGIHGLSRLPTPTDAGLGVTTRFILFWKKTAQSNPTIVQALAPIGVYAGNVLTFQPPQHTN